MPCGNVQAGVGNAACTNCGADRYSMAVRQIAEEACLACPADSKAPAGSNDVSNCIETMVSSSSTASLQPTAPSSFSVTNSTSSDDSISLQTTAPSSFSVTNSTSSDDSTWPQTTAPISFFDTSSTSSYVSTSPQTTAHSSFSDNSSNGTGVLTSTQIMKIVPHDYAA